MALGFQHNDRPCWVRQSLSGVQPMGAPYMGLRGGREPQGGLSFAPYGGFTVLKLTQVGATVMV